jgi:pimeloyl-ACP methyl ester carboxylesterase
MHSSIINSKLPNLVFLHGWGGCWQSWYPILERLQKDFNLYAPDLPGFGREPIPKPYQLDDYVDFVINYIQDNKIKNPILIGHSFGGAIISKIAANHLISLSKIILVDAAPIRHLLTPKQKIVSLAAKSLKIIFNIPLLHRFYQPTKKFLYKSLKLDNSGYSDLENPILKKTFTTVIREDLSVILPQINIPTLIIWGERDIATPLVDGQKTHQLIKHSQFIVFSNASHFSYLDNQEQFITEIKKFIKS